MNERRLSTMPPHRSMPHSIPRIRGEDRHWPVPHQSDRKSADNPYKKPSRVPSRVNHGPQRFDDYIGPVDVIPGEQLFVIAQLRGVIINEEFVPQPAKTPTDTLVLAAKARIGLREGFFAVLAGGNLLRMRVGDAAGLLQEIRVKMPPYDPTKLVVEYNNSLIIASAFSEDGLAGNFNHFNF